MRSFCTAILFFALATHAGCVADADDTDDALPSTDDPGGKEDGTRPAGTFLTGDADVGEVEEISFEDGQYYLVYELEDAKRSPWSGSYRFTVRGSTRYVELEGYNDTKEYAYRTTTRGLELRRLGTSRWMPALAKGSPISEQDAAFPTIEGHYVKTDASGIPTGTSSLYAYDLPMYRRGAIRYIYALDLNTTKFEHRIVAAPQGIATFVMLRAEGAPGWSYYRAGSP